MDDLVLRDPSARVFLDVTPLFDTNWTGIPAVCANLARALLAMGCDLRFCVERDVLPREAVQDALSRNTGLFLDHEYRTGAIIPGPLVWPAGIVGVGLSTSVKRMRRMFAVEGSFIHDISTLLQPQYHTPENIAWHTERIVQDIASNDVTFCVSKTTMDDVTNYLGTPLSRLVLAYNGIEWLPWFRIRADGELADGAEPYVVVLATREPRKNLSLVFELLSAEPDLLEDYRWVFIGKPGWLLDQTIVPDALLWAIDSGRIVQTGFVTEYQKYLMLRGAIMTLFPSIFEGFGLPVLESISVATPCVSSFSSSMPEVGGSLCFYFDPFSIVSLEKTIRSTLALNLKRKPAYEAECAAWASRFSWMVTAKIVMQSFGPAIQAAALDQRGSLLLR